MLNFSAKRSRPIFWLRFAEFLPNDADKNVIVKARIKGKIKRTFIENNFNFFVIFVLTKRVHIWGQIHHFPTPFLILR